MAALPIRVFRAGVHVATFAHNTSAENVLADPRVQPAAVAAATPNALQQRGVATADAIAYSQGAVPGGDYDVIDRATAATDIASSTAGGWMRDLTREGVEANPGPALCQHPGCDCAMSRNELAERKENEGYGLPLSGACPGCQHLVSAHQKEKPVAAIAASTGRNIVTIDELLDALHDAVTLPVPVVAAAAVTPTQVTDTLAELSLSPPALAPGAPSGRPSLTRHQATLPSAISAALFGSYLKFVNRHEQCDALIAELQHTYQQYKRQRHEHAPEYIKSLRLVFSAGAPGIGKTTWARLALDYHRRPSEGGPVLDDTFAAALQQCRDRGRRYRISYVDSETTRTREMRDPGLSIAARWLWEHVKYRVRGATFERLWNLLEMRHWRITCEAVHQYICGTDSLGALCLINLDEVNVLFPDGATAATTSSFLSASLSALLHLQKDGIGCVIPVLTATKALELEGVVRASGAQYKSIPLPLLRDDFVHQMVLDLQQRAAAVCAQPSATAIPRLLHHLLALMAGNPRFLELLLFRLGRQDGTEDVWSPSAFLLSWRDLEQGVGSASASDFQRRWLRPVLDCAVVRYAHFDRYICTSACAAIVPELLYHSLFERPIERTDSLGDCLIRVLEENGVVFLSPLPSSESDSSQSPFSTGSPPRLRLVLPFLWLHRILVHFEANHSNFVHVPLLSSLESYLTPHDFESLAVSVLALRCYFHAKHGHRDADGHVRVTSAELMGVPAMDGSSPLLKLPVFASTCWRVLHLRHLVVRRNWSTFAHDPAKLLEPAQRDSCRGLAPCFFLNGAQAPFWDGCALLEPAVFLQCKRSQLSLEREASGGSASTFSWASVLAEVRKCAVDVDASNPLRPWFVLCSDQDVALPTVSSSTVQLRPRTDTSAAAPESHIFLIDATNHRAFFGSLLAMRKAMSCF